MIIDDSRRHYRKAMIVKKKLHPYLRDNGTINKFSPFLAFFLHVLNVWLDFAMAFCAQSTFEERTSYKDIFMAQSDSHYQNDLHKFLLHPSNRRGVKTNLNLATRRKLCCFASSITINNFFNVKFNANNWNLCSGPPPFLCVSIKRAAEEKVSEASSAHQCENNNSNF